MKERPILFSAPMMLAILEGRKTQTRRLIKPVQPRDDGMWPAGRDPVPDCPYGRAGDHLWVRETWGVIEPSPSIGDRERFVSGDSKWMMSAGNEVLVEYWRKRIVYRATHDTRYGKACEPSKWRPSIFLPRWACRTTLEVTGVRVERLQEISPRDAQAEGSPEFSGLPAYHDHGAQSYVHWYSHLWDSLNAKRGFGWASNPWVWVVEFQRLKETQNVSATG